MAPSPTTSKEKQAQPAAKDCADDGVDVAAFIFASIVLALAAVAALLLWAWLAWRLRRLRRAGGRGEGVVIEGEYRVERETRRVEERSD